MNIYNIIQAIVMVIWIVVGIWLLITSEKKKEKGIIILILIISSAILVGGNSIISNYQENQNEKQKVIDECFKEYADEVCYEHGYLFYYFEKATYLDIFRSLRIYNEFVCYDSSEPKQWIFKFTPEEKEECKKLG